MFYILLLSPPLSPPHSLPLSLSLSLPAPLPPFLTQPEQQQLLLFSVVSKEVFSEAKL